MADIKLTAGVDLSVNASSAQNQLKDLQKQLQEISNTKINIGTGNLTADIEKASAAAMQLSAHLANATNPQTGNLDFTKFYTSIQKSGASLEDYGKALQNIGPAGQKAFVSLADSISKSEIPLKRTSKLMDGMWDNLKKTVGWSISSSMVNSFVGSIQQAIGYAKDLDRSLNDIRIVTGQSGEQMATFAKQANIAAKQLSTTTTDYTKASLIYYQQGLSDQEVKARTETTIKMANATGQSAQTVSDQMTAIWNNYDNGTKSLTHYADVMTALGAATASSTDEIAEGLQKFASISDTVGLSYEYAASALATVTSTTRESADVVGNSFKTLFSRIQGLQLGETLDDGTTLNKYSEALASAGISIKDQSGELKSMDNILNEMGETWGTLAKDEKMALAQTVAGVRQYTQLMALMENWDFFKQNLNIANTSSGTLDKQALIYADSWEAASNRMKASMEGLWDSLIKSDTAVGVMDFFSTIISGVESIVDGLGGASGVLSVFGATLLKVFSPQISKTISDTAFNIGMMFGGQKRMKEARDNTLKNAINVLSNDYDPAYGEMESRERKRAIEGQLRASLKYAENKDHMSPIQRLYEEQYKAQAQARYDARINAAKQYDNEKTRAYDAQMGLSEFDPDTKQLTSVFDKAANILNYGNFDDKKTKDTQKEIDKLKKEQEEYEKEEKELNEKEERSPKEELRLKELQELKTKNINNQTAQTDKQKKTLTYDDVMRTQAQALGEFQSAIAALGDDPSKAAENFESLKTSMSKFASDAGLEDGYFNKFFDSLDQDNLPDAKKKANAIASQLSNGIVNDIIKDLGFQDAEGDSDEIKADKAKKRGLVQERFQGLTGMAAKGEDLKRLKGGESEEGDERDKNLKQSKVEDWADGLTMAAEGAASVMALTSSLKALQAGGLDATGTMSALIGVLGSAGNSVSSFASAVTLLTGISGGAATAIGAITAALGLFIGWAIEKTEQIKNADKNAAVEAAESAQTFANARDNAKQQHQTLVKQIEDYGNAENELNTFVGSAEERARKIGEINEQALGIINQHNLVEGTDINQGQHYYKDNEGVIRFNEGVLEQTSEQAKQEAVHLESAARTADIEAKKATTNALGSELAKSIAEQIRTNTNTYDQSLALVDPNYAATATAQQAQQSMTIDSLVNRALGAIAANPESILQGILPRKGSDQGAEESPIMQALLKIFGGKNFGELSSENQNLINGVLEMLSARENEIRDYAAQHQANKNAEETSQEQNARSALMSNEKFEQTGQTNKVSDIIGAQWKAFYDQALENINISNAEIQQKYAEHIGLGNDATATVAANGNIQYTYWKDGKWDTYEAKASDVKAYAATQQADVEMEAQGDKWADQYAHILEVVNGDKDTAGGLFSLLTGDNFANATKKEVNAAKQYLKEFTGNDKDLGSLFGIDMQTEQGVQDFKEKYGSVEELKATYSQYSSIADKLLESFGNSNQYYKDWASENQDMLSTMSEETSEKFYQNLSKISNTGGAESAQQFLKGLTDMITESGISDSNIGTALERLMSIDWGSSEALSQAATILNGLGGNLDIATSSWQAFSAAMQEASGSIPDFSNLISQLTQITGALDGLKIGDIISPELLAKLEELIPGFTKNYTQTQWDGSNRLTRNVDGVRNELFTQAKESYAGAKKQQTIAEKYITGEGALLGKDGVQNLTFSDLVSGITTGTNARGNLTVKATGAATQYASALGYGPAEIYKLNDDMQNVIDEKALYTIQDGKVVGKKDAQGNEIQIEEGKIEETIDQWNQDYQLLLAKERDLRNQQNSMVGELKNFGNTDHDANLTTEAEKLASLYNNMSLFEAGKKDGSGILADSDGNLTQAGIDQLISLASLYPEVTTELENYTNALAANDEQQIKFNEAQLERATAAAEYAKQFGVDYQRVKDEMERLSQLDENKDLSPDVLAKLAAEAIRANDAAEELRKNFSSLMADLNKPGQARSDALKKIGEYLRDITRMSDNACLSIDHFSKAYEKFAAKNKDGLRKIMNGDEKALERYREALAETIIEQEAGSEAAKQFQEGYLKNNAKAISEAEAAIEKVKPGQYLEDALDPGVFQATMDQISGYMAELAQNTDMTGDEIMSAAEAKFNVQFEPDVCELPGGQPVTMDREDVIPIPLGYGGIMYLIRPSQGTPAEQTANPGTVVGWKVKKAEGAPGNTGGGGGGGGGGGQPKEPKKVANKRKSSTVSRYKKVEFKQGLAEKQKQFAEQKKDYFYGEKKIEQLEKINKLTEKEAKLTADRINESRKYLVQDRQDLIRYLQKYDYDAIFDTDGFLSNYEAVWTDIYNQIAALYEDNLLTEEEEKIEEDLNLMLEELEAVLEDYENSLEQLADDIAKYEEYLYSIYDNKVEALEHKVEFKIELEEDDLAYLDWWIETLGDSVYNAIEVIETMGDKANMLFNGLDVYKQGIEDIYALSEDPFQAWATGSLNPDLLTQDQIDMLRNNRDGLMDYAQQLVDLREEIKDKVINTFDLWTERIDASRASLEHYTTVIEHFKNIIDISGQDVLGLNDLFMDRLEQNAINQFMDHIEVNKVYYESLIEQQAKAQEELDAARARGDESSAEHWEEVVRTTTEAMETAQDELLTSLEDTLTMIAEQFETAMQRAIDAFNESLYSYGGMGGLVNDYEMIRENADLMAADYEKIYELSKLTRDINKVLDDTNIVAGKKKMNSLLKEINELQADGVELSKYDLEYLRAKYELRLAEIELENTQNAKDTVRLSKDSEGNWSYVYTQNADAVEEAEQKYEDALYKMQSLSQEYLEEMSSMMLNTSQAMMEEISALRIQDFTSYEAYQTEIKRIQDKYADSLKMQESELNKSIQNSSNLYEQDWQAYNQATGYKISLAENWVDSFREATLGEVLDIDTFMSGFSDTFLGLTTQMSEQLANAAMKYFENMDDAFNKYGTSINGFGTTVTTTVENISNKSKTATGDIKQMAIDMSSAFEKIADTVSDWQKQFSTQINEMLDQISALVQEINEAIRKSAELAGSDGSGALIGSAEAVEELNDVKIDSANGEQHSLGSFELGNNGQIKVNNKTYQNWLDYNAVLIEEIDNAIAKMANLHTGTEERKAAEDELAILFAKYHAFREIVDRIYDNLTNNTLDLDSPNYVSMDTGGYTGEWGNSGKFAMLHEKELVLNSDDTKNFLDALNISKDIVNSMIEMNARASSLGFGELSPSNIPEWNQTLEQTVTITAEFPDATDHNEIEEAFNNLLNTASQYANRNRD